MPSKTLKAVTIDDTQLRRRMQDFRKDQFPYALQLALNDLAFDTMRIEKLEMQQVFDNPHPYVVKGLKIAKKAHRKEANPTAAIWFGEGARDVFGNFVKGQIQQSEVLENIVRPQIQGGTRNRKSTEKRLRQIGVIDENEWMIPAARSKKDRYGNVPPGRYVELLSYFRSFNEGGFSSNRRRGAGKLRSGISFWIADLSARSRGIFERRKDGSTHLVWILTKKTPSYRPRFDFYGEAQRHANKFGPYFAEKAMRKALATAR